MEGVAPLAGDLGPTTIVGQEVPSHSQKGRGGVCLITHAQPKNVPVSGRQFFRGA